MKSLGALLGAVTLLGVAVVLAQPRPGQGPPPPPDPARMVEHAMEFDADGDGKLSREELRKFAEDFARRAPPPPRGPGQGAPAGPLGENSVRITPRGEYRHIEANGIPDHEHGQFPNRGNPNRIAEQHYAFRVPAQPKAEAQPVPCEGIFGMALNGVPFDPGTAELWRGNLRWRYDALSGKIDLGMDRSNAHVQPSGAYHYHGLPHGLIQARGKKDVKEQMVVVGYAADGFPIYNQYGYSDPKDPASALKKLRSSYQLKKGERPGGNEGPGGAYDGTFNQDFEYVKGAGDLDECNGRTAVTPENAEPVYHYVITEQFPFISRLFKGAPDESFRRRGPPPGGKGPPPK